MCSQIVSSDSDRGKGEGYVDTKKDVKKNQDSFAFLICRDSVGSCLNIEESELHEIGIK